MDILWSSIVTAFLCCWSIVCINVPAPSDTASTVFRRKCLMFLTLLFAPEIIAVTVTGQYLSARRSVSDFKAAGISSWTLRHAFFADMGGFVLQTSDLVPFPIDAKQLLWLLQRGYIQVPSPDPKFIKDKNKVDGMMRLIMAVQTLWFLVNFVARLVKGYAITAIELTTVASIYCGLPIMFLWRYKPADIGTPEIMMTEAKMSDILLNGGDAAREPYMKTPLDFISRKEWPFSIYWSHMGHALARLHVKFGSQSRPIDRVSNVSTPEIPFWLFRLGAVAALGFTAILMIGWNFSFLTATERFLWRLSSVVCLVALLAGEVVTDCVFYSWPYWKGKWACTKGREARENLDTSSVAYESQQFPQLISPLHVNRAKGVQRRPPSTLWAWLRNPLAAQDPKLVAPLKAFLPMTFFTSVYIIARLFIPVEDFIELRSLPLSAYKKIGWTQIIPNFG